ncbi:RING/U-box superfamily protein isoform 1 [Dorcoceras hygrometricum]|uniref:RBR-type E3 ubiquitin transferase n=1 Tax=Dorcoceras hygrometricum TaxID=472368 RepID=A0A2Z7CDV6_9LAMI|nr:RING/U-box superfamily protein isoform 1 [Dorcoceras hygrometricum]
MDNCVRGSEKDDYLSPDRDEESLDWTEIQDSDSPSKGSSCKVITRECLSAAQWEDLRTVMELLSLREQHARALLIHHHWDVEKLLTVYLEKEKAFLLSEVGLAADNVIGLDFSSTVMCNICMNDVPAEVVTAMDCGHGFCDNCWAGHFAAKISEGQSQRIKCMAYKCNAICDEVFVRNLLGVRHPDLAERLERFLFYSYIEDNRKAKWCTSMPHCGKAILVEEDIFCEVECPCGSQFCFSCSSEAHSPCPCFMWERWEKKCRDNVSDSRYWINVNTMPCPKCHKPIEKNGGCNSVNCICGAQFWWLPGGAMARKRARARLIRSSELYKEDDEKRYMYHYYCYKAHRDHFKQESRRSERVLKKISALEAKDSILISFNVVSNGLHRLYQSRRILTYSYPFAFYMFGEDLFKYGMTDEEREIKKNLFENLQQLLESNVVKLSEYLELPLNMFTEEQARHIRMQILNLSAATDNLCKKMYEFIEKECTHVIAPYQSKGIDKAEELMAVSSDQEGGSDHLMACGD